jgi:hypothetical protein
MIIRNKEFGDCMTSRQIQCEAFEKEIENWKVQKPIQRDSAILKLDPFIDSEGVLRVGGRLKHSAKVE